MGNLDRIVVIGTSCVGKTTLARALAGALGTTHHELDRLWWLPGWEHREEDEFRALVDEATSAPRWVVDGNYKPVREMIWERATTVIWLNYSFPRVWGRALKRTAARVVRRSEVCNGNRESLTQALFTRESILWWVLATYARRKRKYRERFDSRNGDGRSYIELRTPRETLRFVGKISRES